MKHIQHFIEKTTVCVIILGTMYPVSSQCGCATEIFHMKLAQIAYRTITVWQTIYSYKIMLRCACLKIRFQKSRET